MTAISILSILSLLVFHTYAQDDFTVTSPGAGDTVTLSSSALSGAIVQIQWTVAEALADRPVLINLVRGNNLSSLTLIEQVESNAPNNGSYTWRGNYYGSSLDYGFSDGTPSGCNYSIELKVWTDVVYSSYFTIINPKDGGLDLASQCPDGDEAALGPAGRTLTSDGNNSQDQASSTSTSGGSTSSAGTSTKSGSGTANTGSTTETSGGSTSDDGSSSDGGGGGGISTKTLAIAVAIPVVVLLIVFGSIIWFGMRRGWFVRKPQKDAAGRDSGEKGGAVMESGAGKAVGNTGEPAFLSVRELHGNDLPHQLESKPIHELHGGEDGRR